MKRVSPFAVLVFCLLLLLASGCSRQADTPQARAAREDIAAEARAYPIALNDARRIGLPVSMQELDQPAPDAGNAAVLYHQLGHLLRAYPLSNKELALEGLSTAPLPTQKALGFAKAALAHRAKYLQMAHQAASMPACVFAHHWDTADPEQITFPEMATVREASLMVTGQSVLMAVGGRPLPAVENEALCLRMADQIAGEKVLASYEVGCQIDTVAFTGMQKILYISHGDPKVAQAVQAAIAKDWHGHSLAAAIKSESAFQQGTVAYLRSVGPSPLADTVTPALANEGLPGATAGSSQWGRIMDANAAVLLAETTRAVAAADKPYPEAQPAMKAIVADSMRQAPSRLLPQFLIPNFTGYLTLRAEDQAREEVTASSAAVLSWKATHGSYPGTLAQAMGEAPLDPFDGKPLRFRKEGAGFVVYSVGPSGVFDGGTANDEPAEQESAFRYPLPSYDFPAKPQPAVSA